MPLIIIPTSVDTVDQDPSAPQIVFSVDRTKPTDSEEQTWPITTVNSSWTETFGYTTEEMAGQALAELYTTTGEPQHGSVKGLCAQLRLGRPAVGVVKTRVKGREELVYVHLGECCGPHLGPYTYGSIYYDPTSRQSCLPPILPPASRLPPLAYVTTLPTSQPYPPTPSVLHPLWHKEDEAILSFLGVAALLENGSVEAEAAGAGAGDAGAGGASGEARGGEAAAGAGAERSDESTAAEILKGTIRSNPAAGMDDGAGGAGLGSAADKAADAGKGKGPQVAAAAKPAADSKSESDQKSD